jgi:hypothetical protein
MRDTDGQAISDPEVCVCVLAVGSEYDHATVVADQSSLKKYRRY